MVPARSKTVDYLPRQRFPPQEVIHRPVGNGKIRAERFWVGWGGSIVVMDLDRRTTIAYTMNNMADSLIGSDRPPAT